MPAASNDDVTVVITCFNYGQYVTEAITSAKNQEGGAARIIVVDDGSTEDTTRRVLDEVERDLAVELIRQPNAGASAARNAGLKRADTPYVMVLDADDLLPSGVVRALRPALEAHPDAGYAYGHIRFFGAWGGVMRMPPFDPWRIMFRHIVGPTALMRRELVTATGGYDPGFRYEDWEIWVHALAHSMTGVQVDTPGLLHRKHGTSKFSTDRHSYRSDFAGLQRKHRRLYGDLRPVAAASGLGPAERFLYRRIWGPRPWPAQAETALYSVWWRLH